jgi:hypothetical protein
MATIFVPTWGVEITGISLNQKDGQRWINFPSKMTETNGVKTYYPYIRFREKTLKDTFSEMVKKAIDKKLLEDEQPEQQSQDECPF